jgi:hypothetical protein
LVCYSLSTVYVYMCACVCVYFISVACVDMILWLHLTLHCNDTTICDIFPLILLQRLNQRQTMSQVVEISSVLLQGSWLKPKGLPYDPTILQFQAQCLETCTKKENQNCN